ncbi:MAG: CCA tRNA nucleotidyltransferase [Candidatus Brocadiia bacterium]
MIQRPIDGAYAGAERIVRRLREAGHTALLAGGCVRDMLRGEAPKDYDIATDAAPERVEELFDRTVLVGREFGVCRVLLNGVTYEVARFRRESGYSDGRHPDEVTFCGPAEDARRRDFTINAMFWDPIGAELLDYEGGRRDLAEGLLRAVGDPERRFREDHLRLLRAVRFAARLEFEIEPDTRAAVERLAPLVTRVSAERLQEELRIILTDRDPARALRLMDELGMLGEIFPEIEDMKGCEQPENYHPEGDVFVHSLLSVEKLGPHPDFVVALAALLHDVGKPPASRKADEPMSFPEHCQIGAEMAERICRRLKLSNDETERICWLVERHLYFRHAREMRESTLKRLFAEPGFEQLAEIHRVDALASWGNLENYNYVMRKRRGMSREETEPPRLVTGDDLIEMGYEPGPLFGDVLEQVRDAQLEGEVSTPEKARELARQIAEEAKAGAD